jgi:hypothetical protein
LPGGKTSHRTKNYSQWIAKVRVFFAVSTLTGRPDLMSAARFHGQKGQGMWLAIPGSQLFPGESIYLFSGELN